MSIGSLGGIAAGIAGSPLAQTKGPDLERAQQDTGAQERRLQNERKAENAAGIGETDGEDHETAERDADGRRMWEEPARPAKPASDDAPPAGVRQSKDASGETGTQLDLTG